MKDGNSNQLQRLSGKNEDGKAILLSSDYNDYRLSPLSQQDKMQKLPLG